MVMSFVIFPFATYYLMGFLDFFYVTYIEILLKFMHAFTENCHVLLDEIL